MIATRQFFTTLCRYSSQKSIMACKPIALGGEPLAILLIALLLAILAQETDFGSIRIKETDHSTTIIDTGNTTLLGATPSMTALVTTTLLSESFDTVTPPVLPHYWSKVDVTGTSGDWTTRVGTWHPSGYSAHSTNNLVVFNGFSCLGGESIRLYYSYLDLTATHLPTLTFWMFHDTGFYSSNDGIQVQVSTNGGSNWTNAGPLFKRFLSGVNDWQQHTVDLSAYTGQSNVAIGFLGISYFGNDCHIDDVQVTGEHVEYPVFLPLVLKP